MRNVKLILLILVVSLLTVACESTGPKRVERDYGNSVRQMIAGQTLDPAKSANPDTNGPDEGDGERLNSVLESYRTDVAKPQDVNQPIVISVGSQ